MSDASHATIEAGEVTQDSIRYQVPGLGGIEVRDHGELVGRLLSAQELEHYRTLRGCEVEVFRAGAFSDDIVAALEESKGKYGARVE